MSIAAGWTPANRIALGALAASLLLLGAAAAEARRVEPLPAAPAARRTAAMPEVKPRAATRSDAAILAAVARDPFRPDRRRPAGRYRLPGEAPPPAPVVPVAPVATVYNIQLLGTVVLPDGSGLAALAGQTGESRIVKTGQSFEGFRVTRVTPGGATLRGSDTTLVLRTPGGVQ
ncbi:MAG TPA: hypothetical protein VFR81_25700 [Longimicrobium sp.]|nr:hypothetical protein [Longimicrobium sp.]